jgi:hypothetical protein
MLFVLILLLALAVGGGTWGHSRYGYVGWSPAGILLAVILVMWVTGYVRV